MSVGYLSQALNQMLTPIAPAFDSQAPENITAPFIIYTLITSDRWRNLLGPTTKRQQVVQIDVYSAYASTRDINARAVRDLLDGYRGTVTITGVSPLTSPLTQVIIEASVLQTERQEIEDTVDPRLYRQSMDFSITVQE